MYRVNDKEYRRFFDKYVERSGEGAQQRWENPVNTTFLFFCCFSLTSVFPSLLPDVARSGFQWGRRAPPGPLCALRGSVELAVLPLGAAQAKIFVASVERGVKPPAQQQWAVLLLLP